MGAVTAERAKSGRSQPTQRATGNEIHTPSLLRVHARDICAMLRLRFLASSSTLAAAGGKITDHATRVNMGWSHRLTISWLLGSLRYTSYHLNVRWR
jgi:hypothetical protein